ncbi:hypothetical protein GCM10027589_39100 [Actinocorallia lasiicapitis]
MTGEEQNPATTGADRSEVHPDPTRTTPSPATLLNGPASPPSAAAGPAEGGRPVGSDGAPGDPAGSGRGTAEGVEDPPRPGEGDTASVDGGPVGSGEGAVMGSGEGGSVSSGLVGEVGPESVGAGGGAGSRGDEGGTGGSGGGETPSEDGEPAGEEAKRQPSFWKELPLLIGVALVLALVIKAFIVQAFYIPSGSMETTLQIGDRVLVNKVVYRLRDISRGDIVVFNGLDSWDPEVELEQPSNPVGKVLRSVGTAFGVVPGEKDYIKRVIGVPGDHVVCCEPGTGRITVNGHALDETSYLYTDPATGEQNVPSDRKFDVVVPEGRLWVMGDHREVSYDSRGHSADKGSGTIPISNVIGRAFIVVWPLPHGQFLHIPSTFTQPGLASPLLPYTPLPLALAAAFPLTRLLRRRR